MTYKKGGMAKVGEAQEMVESLREISQVPGGLEMLMTTAAEKLGGAQSGKTKQLRLYSMGGAVEGYAQGGLGQIMQQQAEEVRQAGRGDDEMLLHVSPEEYDALTSMWGEPDINPNTGIPEYGFLSKLWKGIKKTVKKIVKSPLFSFIAPMALNVFAPGLGSAIGSALGATGQTAATIGNTLLRSGVGALSGGKEGAISGALSGLTSSGVGSKIGSKLGLEGATGKIAGDAILGGIAGEGTGVGFQQGALGQATQSLMGNPMQKLEQKITDFGRSKFDPLTRVGMDPMSGGSSSIVANPEDPFGLEGLGIPPTVSGPMSPIPPGADPGLTVFGDPSRGNLLERGVDWVRENPWMAGAGALGIASLAGGAGGDQGPGGPPPLPEGWDAPLPNVSFDRNVMPVENYYNYGRAGSAQPGEQMFFDTNAIPQGDFPGGIPTGGGGVGGFGVPDEVPLGDNMVPYAPISARGGIGAMVRGAMAQQSGWTRIGDQWFPPGWEQSGQATDDQTRVLTGGQGYTGDLEPRQIGGGMAGNVQKQILRSQGWTVEGDMAFPPGWFNAGGTPVPAARGGYVDMPQSPYSMQMQEYKLGGLVKKYQAGGEVAGPGTGRSDDIPAMLSDGEYVFDAETVSLLGDGSTSAGAKRLDEMRKNLRKHKGKKLKEGGFSHDAKRPEEYLAEGGKVKKKPALKDLKRLANRLENAITSGNKKRVKEISDTLRSMHGGKKVVAEMSKGGNVKRILASLEQEMDLDTSESVRGPVERRVRDRRSKKREGDRKGRRLSDKEREELVEELGGFTPKSQFMRRFRQQLREEKAKEGSK